MTCEERLEYFETLRAYPKDFLVSAQVAPLLDGTPQLIRETAREHPEWLGFPVIVYGSRVKIPKLPFLRYIRGEEL